MQPEQHELFDELDAYDPKWQTHYDRLRDAAVAANCMNLYYEFMLTPQGRHYQQLMFGVRDTVAQNRAERETRRRVLAVGLKASTLDDYD